jgi:hypothetical protein
MAIVIAVARSVTAKVAANAAKPDVLTA